jgi:AcrR family transcriptional regulator
MIDKAADQIGRPYRRQSPSERRAARRAKLIDAAVEAFGTNGFRATSIEELCAAAGISTRNFYEEFRGREELLITLHDELNQRAFDAVVQALTDVDPGDLDQLARAGTRAYFEVMTGDRRWARIALVESVGVSPTAEQHRQTAIDRFAQLLLAEANRLADEGLVPKRDYRLTAIALVGAVNGLVNTWTADNGWEAQMDDVAAEAARLITLAIRGS